MDSSDMLKMIGIIFSSSDESSDNEEPPQKIRKYWTRPYYLNRKSSGAHTKVFEELFKINDQLLFKNYIRMSATQFEELLRLVAPIITKQTVVREPLSACLRLSLCLRFLATGESQKSLSIAYKCSPASVHNIVMETTEAITTVLRGKVFPRICQETFKKIAEGFDSRWNFPHCIGAIDGKHVNIQSPPAAGSSFFNYKQCNSIVLLAIVDHNYSFIMCDVGAAGRQSDGGVFRYSEFGKKFYSGDLPFPEPSDINSNFKSVPYVFVADDAFELHTNMMKPYSHRRLAKEERIFNYRLSRARRIVENAFGILSAIWRIFRTTINGSLVLIQNIVESCTCLHNWLRNHPEKTNYITPGLVDTEKNGIVIPGSWRSEANGFTSLTGNTYNATSNAKNLRDKFANYFVESGAVPWQWDK